MSGSDVTEGYIPMAMLGAPELAAARLESSVPVGFRVAKYPNGFERVQGAYRWSEGSAGGHVWRDLPVVDVGWDGQECPSPNQSSTDNARDE